AGVRRHVVDQRRASHLVVPLRHEDVAVKVDQLGVDVIAKPLGADLGLAPDQADASHRDPVVPIAAEDAVRRHPRPSRRESRERRGAPSKQHSENRDESPHQPPRGRRGQNALPPEPESLRGVRPPLLPRKTRLPLVALSAFPLSPHARSARYRRKHPATAKRRLVVHPAMRGSTMPLPPRERKSEERTK